MTEPSTRRQLLGAVTTIGAAGLAGCSGLGAQTGATDAVLTNTGSAAHTVTVTITPADGDEPHTDRTVGLAPGERIDPLNDDKIPLNTDYTVEVAVENGPEETFEWTDTDVERAPLYIEVDDSDNVDFFVKVG